MHNIKNRAFYDLCQVIMATPEEQQRNLRAIMNWSLRQTGDGTASSRFTEMDPEVIKLCCSTSIRRRSLLVLIDG